MKGHTFYNHYDYIEVIDIYGSYPKETQWLKFKANGRLTKCRTDREAYRDGQCKKCNLDTQCHFCVTHDGNVYTKLCIIDVIKHRPIDFKMSIFGSEERRPRTHKQLKLF